MSDKLKHKEGDRAFYTKDNGDSFAVIIMGCHDTFYTVEMANGVVCSADPDQIKGLRR